jgi:hypothetical protein
MVLGRGIRPSPMVWLLILESVVEGLAILPEDAFYHR